jgi:DNA-directed RNA polymerase subunit RPC12/RpoP
MNETTSGEYVCEICGERFETEAELERHVHDAGIVD